ncbi:MAG: alanine racemase [Bacteroidia bacterium]|nr:alanine racemase [Bacteroidia bacterium]
MKITKPTLLIDKNKCVHNIELMNGKALSSGVKFRPHFKTHQSAVVGKWFRDFGIDAITVSSVTMANYFAENGWNDITVAFPVNIHEIDDINRLAAKINLNIVLLNPESLNYLEKTITSKTGALIKADCGYHRSGIDADHIEKIYSLSNAIVLSTRIEFNGILAHFGNTYSAKNKEEVKEIYETSLSKLKHLCHELKGRSEKLFVSIGDTPSCSVIDEFKGVDEIRPGNFVFYDSMQLSIGSCTQEQIAVALACPVVAKNKERNEIVIYGGAVHLSKDFIEANSTKIFGYIAEPEENGWGEIIENTFVKSLSQEHGIIKASDKFFNKVSVGDVLYILPVHSCLTADLMRQYLTLDGEKIEMMKK